MKIENENSINTLIVQRQSSQSSLFNGGFSSLLNQENQKEHKEEKEVTEEETPNHWQSLQNQAYLNKLVLGIVA